MTTLYIVLLNIGMSYTVGELWNPPLLGVRPYWRIYGIFLLKIAGMLLNVAKAQSQTD